MTDIHKKISVITGGKMTIEEFKVLVDHLVTIQETPVLVNPTEENYNKILHIFNRLNALKKSTHNIPRDDLEGAIGFAELLLVELVRAQNPHLK